MRWQRIVLAAVMAAAGCQQMGSPALETAPPSIPVSQAGLSLTVYSSADPGTFDPQALLLADPNDRSTAIPGYGVVRDTRKCELKTGENTLSFVDVAAGIDPTTVSLRTVDGQPGEVGVIEQNFKFDLMNSAKLLKKYIGTRVTVDTPGREGCGSSITGKLLAANAGDLVVQTDDGKLQLTSQSAYLGGRTELAAGQTGLVTKPTLELIVNAAQAGPRLAEITYQTDNLTWRADYSLLLNEKDTGCDISSWVTLVNQSGANYPNTQLKLIAGDVRRFKPEQRPNGGLGGSLFSNTSDQGFKENPLFEYHMYTLARNTTLPDNSIKQLELFPPRREIAVKKIFTFDVVLSDEWRDEDQINTNPGEMTKKASVCVVFKNTEANHLGIPLPAGRVRVYKKGPDGAAEFVGEDVVDHTPKDEELNIRVGSAFDVVGTRVRTAVTGGVFGLIASETYEVTLRNHKTEDIQVTIRDEVGHWRHSGEWKVEKCSLPYTLPNANTLWIPVDLPAGAEKKVQYKLVYRPEAKSEGSE